MMERRSSARWYALLAGVLLLTPPWARSQEETRPEGPPVISVEVRGNVRISSEFVLSQVRTAVGKPFDRKVLDEDIRRLGGHGLFSNIEVDEARTPDGIGITFVVEENILVQRVELVGVEELDEDDVRSLIKLRTGQPLVKYLLHLDRERIRQKYLEEGYLFAEVLVETKPTLSGEEVAFRVQEGPEVEVDDIRFVGNATFDEGELEDLMQTDESWLLSSKKFREDVLREDLVTLKSFYRSKGFFDVEIELQDVSFSPDLEEMGVVIFVEEGPRYTVEEIEVQGLGIPSDQWDDRGLFSRREFFERFRQKEGAFFDQADILHDRSEIQDLYEQNAFLDSSTEIDFFYSTEGNQVSILYTIEEGGPSRIARIDFRGNLWTRDDVLRRHIRQLPWQYANMLKMKEGQRNLQRTSWFETVEMKVEDGRLPGEKNVVYEVEEGQTGSIRLAAGVTSNIGFLGEVTVEKQNFDISDLPKSWDDFVSGGAFTGGGQNVILQFQPGTDLIRFRAGFVEPYLFGYPYSLGLNAQYMTRERESYDEVRIGGDVTLGHRFAFDPHLQTSLTYRNEVVEIEDVDRDAPSFVQLAEGATQIASLALGWDYDLRDDDIVPSKGYRLGQSSEVAHESLGGDETFYKLDVRGEWYTTVYRTEEGHPHVVGLLGRFGYGDAFGDTEEIPIFERYYAGGSGSLRGFDFRGVGPMENGDPIGGQVMALATVEYTFPIYRDFLRGVLFVDSGTVARDFDSGELSKWRVAAGFGFRIKIPMLGQRPFAIDFGFPIRKEDDDEEEILSFSFGRTF